MVTTHLFCLRLSEADRTLLNLRAKESKLSTSEYVRVKALYDDSIKQSLDSLHHKLDKLLEAQND